MSQEFFDKIDFPFLDHGMTNQEQIEKLKQELAAERDEVRIMTNQCVQLRRELAAQRQRREAVDGQLIETSAANKRHIEEAHAGWKKTCDKLQQQHLSALAAIERLVKMYVANLGTDHEFICCIGSSHASDLTAKERKNDKLWSAWDAARKIDLSALKEKK